MNEFRFAKAATAAGWLQKGGLWFNERFDGANAALAAGADVYETAKEVCDGERLNTEAAIDYSVTSNPTIWIFRPVSDKAKRHATRRFRGAITLHGAVAVEARYGMDCLYAIVEHSQCKAELDGHEVARMTVA